ncbi:MAG: hypothetical protein ACJA1H_002177 [Glaciecola sp.]|jgi:hypothetical protein
MRWRKKTNFASKMTLAATRIINYLKEPYPYYYGSQLRLIVILVIISILSFSFSYFFEPFRLNVTEHKINSNLILLIHAWMPFPIAYLYMSILNNTIKKESSWTLGKELFHLSSMLFIIGLAGFLVRDVIYSNPDNWSMRYFWEEIRNTFLVGFLILSIVLPLNLERLIHKHTSSVITVTPNRTEASQSTLVVLAHANEHFELDTTDFLYAKVDSNYTEIFRSSPSGIEKTLLRITLKEVEEQLQPVLPVFKTHRSYLVNLTAITSISGNAQGYQLLLKNCPTKIPVSRFNMSPFNTMYAKV